MSPKAPKEPQEDKAAEEEQIEAQAAEEPVEAKAEEPNADEPKAEEPKAEEPKEAEAPKPRQRRRPARKAAADDKSEDKPAPKPAPRRTRTPTAQRRAVVRAKARYVRTSARKARMVTGHIRGKSVPEARAILAFTPREVAVAWSKLLESAVANAENNHELIGDDLMVRDAFADEGPTIKRFRPRAMGRATPIRKRTSHLTITLTPKP